jgi:hypothetical protein
MQLKGMSQRYVRAVSIFSLLEREMASPAQPQPHSGAKTPHAQAQVA